MTGWTGMTGAPGVAGADGDGEAAIYCRISHVKDEDQTGVERQERICRELAARLGVRVRPEHVFVDNSRSAWQRKRKRPGWDGLLEAIRAGRVRHVLAYHPDRLMRQPWDLEELLRLADDQRLILHGQANRRDLSNADDRFFLRIEVAHACKSSDDTSRRVKSAQEEAAAAGRMHGGPRSFGYGPGGVLVEDEAKVVREVFGRFLDGDALSVIAADLNRRGVTTATGKAWTEQYVRVLVSSPKHAGIRVHRGQVVTDATGAPVMGVWPGCVSVGTWQEAQRLRRQRSAAFHEGRAPRRDFLLRGLVLCTSCGRPMAGTSHNGYPSYVCVAPSKAQPKVCKRRISAVHLEGFVTDAAVDLLSRLNVTALSADAATATVTAQERAAEVAEDQARLAELQQMWIDKELPTDEYRQMRAAVASRIARNQRATVVRPLTALQDVVTGPGARQSFDALPIHRQAAVLKFLFAAVRIDAPTHRGRGMDYDRISIEQNPL
ncbi:MAG TPA: recombinase family protein [Kineosporiaceae bacterium]|nr:recombinase family protein [Kineosporiaceae bacterium]